MSPFCPARRAGRALIVFVTSAPQNLVRLNIQHGVQRFLHRAEINLDNCATRTIMQGTVTTRLLPFTQ